MTKELKRPTSNTPNRDQADSTSTSTPTPTSEQRSGALSTSVAHGMRSALSSQMSHLQGLQDAYSEAASPVVEEASEFFAAAMSGELLWQGIAEQTQERLAALPKPERVDLSPPKLRGFSFQRSEATGNRFLGSSPTAFLPSSNDAA